MARIFPEYKRSTVYAVILGILHFTLMLLIFIFEFMGVGGEKNPLGWLVGFWDLPIWALESFVKLPTIFNGKFTIIIGGTFLAAVEGWIGGAVVDAFLNWRLKNRIF